MKRFKNIYWIIITLFCSCSKLIEVDAPYTGTSSENVYNTDETAISVLTGLYADMSREGVGSAGSPTSFSLFGGLSADEWNLYSGVSASDNLTFYYKNTLSIHNGGEYWNGLYQLIYRCNAALEGLQASAALSAAVQQQLSGEAYFLRAFYYYYLVSLYGDVPLVINTDYKQNALLARSQQDKVWTQIVEDLNQAQILLSDTYLDGTLKPYTTTAKRIRPVKAAAQALLARVYLYQGNYTGAAEQATAVINQSLYGLPALKDVFLDGSNEAIWQLQPVNANWNTEEARKFIIPATGPSTDYPVFLSDMLLNSFETGDLRRQNWVDSVKVTGITYHYPYKYKIATLSTTEHPVPVTEYSMVIRLAEQYLIRAEARSHNNDIKDAIDDLNMIRHRAGLSDYTGPQTQEALQAAILKERRVELFTEWGHRWLDLKRTHTVDAIMQEAVLQKGTTWNTNWQWYPIPEVDMLRDPNLLQNTGY